MRTSYFWAALILSFVASAYGAERWRPADTVGDWNKTVEFVYGQYLTDCTMNSNVDAALDTTVDVESASGQKVLSLASTGTLANGDLLLLNAGGARQEICTVDTVSAGVSATCLANLGFTHPVGDHAQLMNRIGPLEEGFYEISATDSTYAGAGVTFLQGPATVLATTDSPTLEQNEIKAMRVLSPNLYMSAMPSGTASNLIFKACKKTLPE